jgi:hypothetical protein
MLGSFRLHAAKQRGSDMPDWLFYTLVIIGVGLAVLLCYEMICSNVHKLPSVYLPRPPLVPRTVQQRSVFLDARSGATMKTAQAAAMRKKADEFDRLAALAANRATKDRFAELAIHWHWKAGQAEKTSGHLDIHQGRLASFSRHRAGLPSLVRCTPSPRS